MLAPGILAPVLLCVDGDRFLDSTALFVFCTVVAVLPTLRAVGHTGCQAAGLAPRSSPGMLATATALVCDI